MNINTHIKANIKERIKSLRSVFVFFLFLIQINTGLILSQKPYTPKLSDPLTEPWRWKRYYELDGKGINSMLQTKDGVYWFATSKGLFRFNGLEWSNPSISKLGTTCYVRNLCLSCDSLSVYIGTDSGIYYISRNKVIPVFVSTTNKRINRLYRINKLILLRDSSILACMGFNQYNALLRIKGSRKILYTTNETYNLVKSKLVNTVFKCIDNRLKIEDRMTAESIFQDNLQNIWMSIVKKDDKIGKNKIASFRFDKAFPDSMVQIKVFEESPQKKIGRANEFGQSNDNKIWIVNSDFNIGIYVISGNRWDLISTSGFNGFDNMHTSILNGRDGTIWVGGFGVLYAFKNNRWTMYSPPLINIPNSRVFVYEDRKGYLWIFGEKKEIYQVDYSNIAWITYKGLNYQAQSGDGKAWYISVDNKVVIRDKDRWYAYDTSDGLPDAVVKLIITSNGTPWVAGSHKGTACAAYFRQGKWTKLMFPDLSWGIDARAVFEDSKGNLWLGCAVNISEKKGHLGGVIKLENPGQVNQKCTHYSRKQGIKSSNSYGIGETKDGRIWMCGSSLSSFDGNVWTKVSYPFENTQYQEIISTIKGGDMWIGSRFYGVLKTDGNKWENFTIDSGLLSNTVISILPINDKDIWVATDNDICKFDGKVWTTNIFPSQMTLIREGGELIHGSGKLWINHSLREWKRRAFSNYKISKEVSDQFQTIGYKADTFPPDTKIKFYSKKVSFYGNTIISWTGSDLSLSTPSTRISYSYRINNGEWSPFKEKTFESFTGLPSGNYKFEVRARDLDFNIDPTPACIQFRVLAPIWKQLWFIILIILFIIIIVIYEIREKQRQFKLVRLNKTLQETKDNLENKQHEIIEQNRILELQKIHIIEQNNREKEAQQLKLRFFTNVSHEFRTPLTIINGIISKITESLPSKVSKEYNNNLTTLQRNANQLLKLISQLMDFRKLETGALQLKVTKGDICWYVKEVCDTFNNLASLNQIRLEFSSPGKFEVFFDADFIEKILNNLLSNAIKFTPQGGVVKVSIHKDAGKNADYFSITVEDTGIGIPADEINKIFEPFYQVNQENSNQAEGTGIGLSLVNNLVKAHHGELKVTSIFPVNNVTSGFITCFTIKLPKDVDVYDVNEIVEDYKESPKDMAVSPVIQTKDKEKTDITEKSLIMVVEDNADLRNLITTSLKDYFVCCEADNGLSAFDLAVDQLPDLIVSDIMMPKMNGIELCHKLKNDTRTSHIPVILLTARTAVEHIQEGYITGADDYVIKPFNMSLLITRINNLIEIRSLLRKQFSREFRLQASDQVINSVDADFLKKVIDIIENNIANPEFGVEALGSELNMGTRNLLRKILSLTEYKPVELIRIIRLKRAEQILLQNRLTVAEIAYDVGFTDPGYFTKCFVSYFGLPPKEYIKKKEAEI